LGADDRNTSEKQEPKAEEVWEKELRRSEKEKGSTWTLVEF
jgi:hypothetical protein